MKYRFGIYISPDTKIGEGFCIIHPGNICINQKAIIGSNVSIRQGTTIGNNGRDDFAPVLGNNINIGCNVCIIGNVNIGNNVIIGAGTVVVKSIPDDSMVVGNPGLIVKKYHYDKRQWIPINDKKS